MARSLRCIRPSAPVKHLKPLKVYLTQKFVSSTTNLNIRKLSYENLQAIKTELVNQEPTKYLRIKYTNDQSRNKTEEISDLIIEHDIDILLITAAWLAQHEDEVTLQNLARSNFICKSFLRPNRRCGGIAIV